MDGGTFDFIIVGAGSAGAVLANRLSADGKHTVLLLEAGRADHPWTRVPIGFAKMIENPAANWLYHAAPEIATAGRPIAVPRGKLLGGSSAINGMVYVRGQAQDFDTWAQLGNAGWSFRDVLPFFRRMESYGGGEDEFRGRDGPLRVSDVKEAGPLYDALIAAARQNGIGFNDDYNGAAQEGIAMTQATIRNGRRMSTARCYLDPARRRANLTILTGAHADRLLLAGGRCHGVRYTARGAIGEARAVREVIVCGGTINSPQLLELSGIGGPEILGRHGIAVQHALPGVGENLRDHYAPRMKWAVRAPGLTYNDQARGPRMVLQALRYLFTGSGFLGLPASPIRAYVRTRDGLSAPNAVISWMPFLAEGGLKLAARSGLTAVTHALRPESTGSIHIAGPDSKAPPIIRFKFLSAAPDSEITLDAMRLVRRIMAAPAMAALAGAEIAPGAAINDDGALLDWVRATAETAYHPVGTCKMGADALAVVDSRLRVHGIHGLRVADASIMPTLTSGNTNAPAIMIGEKAAAMVLESAV